ncbi:CLH domain-containing protein [Aspergillus brunneoviolaceus CBS 621.78]|uniref:Vacuolar assembly protein n=1 Tax=Aspergillus brunneoviolaceus CBS 621.78 TaxID=1450534 RepID=A0ACD1GFA6_9EURO|nr:putative vacuolar assembly protein [Aspergillus brunneoviolaceus CBS 621.78]RAH48000.1 putative vacuolar assembly protein [Aspergillus brunneoviolaceus CBS 621.78]
MDAPGATEATGTVRQDGHPPDSHLSRTTSEDRKHRSQPAELDETDHGHNDEGTESETEAGDDYHEEDDDDDDDDDSEEDEDEEPRLKYAYLTKHLGAVYRNGDATSAFLAAGDKMVIGSHNGNIHVLSVPQLRSLRVYHAHSASITSVSISPYPPPLPNVRPEYFSRFADDPDHASSKLSSGAASLRGRQRTNQPAIPSTPSNSIYIATSSIDGNVCVASLLDSKDVLLRNFGRPVQAVALSPEYKSDRTYLSGGRAGDLILTVGGRVGVSTNSTTMGGAAAAASSWLGSIGLGANTGKDTVLHGGEGAISTIKWSLSGKYIVWVNEEGIKIMRSNLHLDSSDAEFAWKRISHIDRPNRPGWEEMASVWKAHAEWVDENSLDLDDSLQTKGGVTHTESSAPTHPTIVTEKVEKLVVGWGGTVWVIEVYPDRPSKNNRDHKIGSVEVTRILRTDCVISGISLFTPKLLVVLAYMEAEQESSEDDRSKHGGRQTGTRRRPRGLEPELRIIDLETETELSADSLSTSRFETLTSSDYHMCILPPWKTSVPASQRGALETIGNGLWDATFYPVRLFNSGASIRSTTSSGDKGSSRAPSIFASRRVPAEEPLSKEIQDMAGSIGPKILVHSPYDCVVALKRDLADRLAWLDAHEKYEEAWTLLKEHPEAAGTGSEMNDTVPGTPSISQGSFGESFIDDAASVITTTARTTASAAEQEKRRIGELWIEQLVEQDQWPEAAEVCTKALDTTHRWEHWAWKFVEKDKWDEISPVLPLNMRPPLSANLYETILSHYVEHNRPKFSELVDEWPFDLFDANNVATAVEEQLGELTTETDDWRILSKCLAKLYLAGGHYGEALHCYIRLQDADTAMALIRDHRLLDTLTDDIPAFILIRVSKEQLKSAPTSELEELTAEPIKLLVSEAYTGIVRPDLVVEQLQAANRLLYLYFYLRALWRGESLPHGVAKPRRGHFAHIRDAASKLAADEGKALVDNFADTAVELFADYDRPLLMEFLQISTAYAFDLAVNICETRHFTPELIYLLSKTGQTKRALNLILADLEDVSQAIQFAKAQNEPDLWEDLLDYSMDKPRFIHGLLVEAGTAIDPIKLVRRIPSGLEIEGLRDGLTRMIREHDLQASISQGAAKVLQSEVAVGMDTLRRGQRRGIKFNIIEEEGSKRPITAGTIGTTVSDAAAAATTAAAISDTITEKSTNTTIPAAAAAAAAGPTQSSASSISSSTASPAGRCAGCSRPFRANEKEILVGFACGHVFHLSHIHQTASPSTNNSSPTTPYSRSAVHTPRPFSPSRTITLEDISTATSRTVGPKVTTARLLRDRVGEGCRICTLAKELDAIGDSDA